MTYVLVVGAALVDSLDSPSRLLAGRRSAPSALAGGWELPGGKVEPGEDPEAALHRELAEELGIGVRLGADVPCPDTADGLWPLTEHLRLRVWWAEITEGRPLPLQDHDRLEWLDVARGWASAVPWLDGDRPVVERLGRHLAAGRDARPGLASAGRTLDLSASPSVTLLADDTASAG